MSKLKRKISGSSGIKGNDRNKRLRPCSKGKMYCWGSTGHGELGVGGIEDEYIKTPKDLAFPHDVIKRISCGRTHTLLLTVTGRVYSCGNNDHGQLGHTLARTKFHPIEDLSPHKIIDIAGGENHSMALNEWGQIFTWGLGTLGQLGNVVPSDTSPPKLVKGLATAVSVQIACGYSHCLALTNKGELYSWGCNQFGQLGIGYKSKPVPVPTLVSSLIGLPIAYIACGAQHSFVVSRSGAVYGWGRNNWGQLGLNSTTDHVYPAQLKTLRSIRVKYIACGQDFSVFLTEDGGVLTCGAGQSGQLGHGGTANEAIPRKVLELMGSTVTQVSCGRRHTLAYIASRQRVYAFGLGGTGQLGSNTALIATTPQVVKGPWLEGTARVHHIAAGGDRCFVTLLTDYGETEDFRLYPPQSQIWSLTRHHLGQCERYGEEDSVDQDLLSYLETVLTSQSCINGSFLLSENEHYCCTSKHHGVDLIEAEHGFSTFRKSLNRSILDLVFSSITQLINELPVSPPDVETLRVYLIIPLYHEFDNVKHSTSLQGPFASSILNLKKEAAKIVENWFHMTNTDYLERLINNYKNVVIYQLRTRPSRSANQFDLTRVGIVAVSALKLLSSVYKLNSKSRMKIPYETFHIPEVTELADIRVDYVKWLMEDRMDCPKKPYLCSFPFIFDAEAKTLLLQTDQSLQMQSAMNEAAQSAITRMLFSPGPVLVTTLLEIHVTRENIVQDTIRELANCYGSEFKKPLKVHFIGEEAEDAGGVKKEFFLLLLREFLDPKYGMFTSDPETNAIWFSGTSFEDETMYYLIGLVCGLAMYNFIIINLPFPLALYKKLLKEPVDLQDLKGLSPSLANGLQALLDYEDDNLDEVFCLKFEITNNVFGEIVTTPLKPNGSDISVTRENKAEYVELYVDYILNKSIERHFTAFKDAFDRVCGGNVLQLFHSHELMSVVIGNESYDWDTFENVADYRGGYSSSDPTIRLFWEVFHELSLAEKKKFLVYLTGTDRIPIQGMKAVKIFIQPTQDERFLPVAHTCFNLLDLPRYSTKERLKYKLLQAIQQTEGFSIV